MTYRDYEWFLHQDLSKYSNQWVAIINQKIVSNNKDINKLMKKLKNDYPKRTPFITKVRNKLSIL